MDPQSNLPQAAAGLDLSRLPRHVAIIMDGNGRWAKRRGYLRVRGHLTGVESVRVVVRLARKLGIEYLTLYAFSDENWQRPTTEIRALMNILSRFVRKELVELRENQIVLGPSATSNAYRRTSRGN
jgi:undecaprenyl diphosphate synthase